MSLGVSLANLCCWCERKIFYVFFLSNQPTSWKLEFTERPAFENKHGKRFRVSKYCATRISRELSYIQCDLEDFMLCFMHRQQHIAMNFSLSLTWIERQAETIIYDDRDCKEEKNTLHDEVMHWSDDDTIKSSSINIWNETRSHWFNLNLFPVILIEQSSIQMRRKQIALYDIQNQSKIKYIRWWKRHHVAPLSLLIFEWFMRGCNSLSLIAREICEPLQWMSDKNRLLFKLD